MRLPSFAVGLFWVLLALPAVYLVAEKFIKDIPGGRFFAVTGEISVWLMFVALAQTPLERIFRDWTWIRTARPYRRHIGVAAFAYAGLHLAYWLVAVNWARIMQSLSDPVLISGWLPFFGMAVMAATSNDWSLRKLRKTWKPIQRVIYICAPVIVLHWFIAVNFRTQTMLIYGGLLLAWAMLRISTARPRRAAN